ncbi:MAG: glycoside hydrolase family 88 protein [Prevotella sp.]|jgi:rhamnogalacturonyl hydrolase YesR|nr:glycoside hydrolase family 88 protein [Prevotella sp.]
MKKTVLFIAALALCASVGAKNPKEFTGFPKGSDPETIGQRLIQRYLVVSDNNFGTKRPLDYPKVCSWFGALRFADVTKDKTLLRQLEERFFPLLGPRKESMQTPNHVDNSVFGIVPLKLYMLTGNELYYYIGMDFADRQWLVPDNPRPENVEKYKALSSKGLTWQTRFWIDDMYMITSVQSQAYAASKDVKYINRAAYEMTVYLDSIQQPNGLFLHEKTAPFFWARGNGWMAAGMADLLKYLPENNPDRPRIMQEYRKMMATMKSYRNSEGIWNQLINEPDAWPETSGSAMFTYAMITGVKKGWLDAAEYAPVARQAWLSLLTYLNDDGNLREVCIGTNIGFTKEYYMQRPRPVGDLHGQAALLWCVDALLEN